MERRIYDMETAERLVDKIVSDKREFERELNQTQVVTHRVFVEGKIKVLQNLIVWIDDQMPR